MTLLELQFYRLFGAELHPAFLYFLNLPCRSNPADERSQRQVVLWFLRYKFLHQLRFHKLSPESWRVQDSKTQVCCSDSNEQDINATEQSLFGICPDTGSLSNNFLPRCCAVWESLAQEVKKIRVWQ